MNRANTKNRLLEVKTKYSKFNLSKLDQVECKKHDRLVKVALLGNVLMIIMFEWNYDLENV